MMKMLMQIFSTFAFVTVSICDLAYVFSGNDRGRLVTKPLIMPLLALFYITNARTPESFIIYALACGFAGDVFLLWSQKRAYLLFGGTAFILGHISYAAAFLTPEALIPYVPFWFYIFLIPYIVLLCYFSVKAFKHTGRMGAGLVLYGVVLLTMCFVSLCRIWVYNDYRFWFPCIGAHLFALSDLVYGTVFSGVKFKNGMFYGMLLYILAQLLIVLGFM